MDEDRMMTLADDVLALRQEKESVEKQLKDVNKRLEEKEFELRNRGMDYLFTVNAQTLSAKVKELIEENDGTMPQWLDGLINTYEKQYVSIRKN